MLYEQVVEIALHSVACTADIMLKQSLVKYRGRFTYKPSAMHSSSSSSPFTSCVSDLTPEGIRRLGFLSRIELAFENGVGTLFLRLVFQTRQCMGLTLGTANLQCNVWIHISHSDMKKFKSHVVCSRQ